MPSDYDPIDDPHWESTDVGYDDCDYEDQRDAEEYDGSDSPDDDDCDEEDEEDVDRTGYVEEIGDDNSSNAEGGGKDVEDAGRTSDSPQEAEDRDERGAGSMSNYEYTKPWGGTGGFMDSYGIDRTPEGYQEANEMVDTMREAAEREGGGGGK
ncbi:hypothetical protein N0V85_006177 [Neurospora sp. IMI 360204]|nr:hypothetical protein N0V85_006177 [Neurospora sp. IMI 360204]